MLEHVFGEILFFVFRQQPDIRGAYFVASEESKLNSWFDSKEFSPPVSSTIQATIHSVR